MSIKKLAGQTAIYGMSSIVARLFNYLLTPYLTRVMSDPAEYGVITDMYALIPFALVLLTMGFESGFFRFCGKADTEQQKQRVFTTTWGGVTAFSLIFLCLVLLFNNNIASVLGYAAHPSFIWIVGTIITLDVITAIPFARLREQGKAKKYVIIRIISVIINFALCVFFYSVLPHLADTGQIFSSFYNSQFGPGYVFVANLIASSLTLIILLPSSRTSGYKIDTELLKKIFIYSLPLLLSSIMGTANEFIDRQMIKYLLPEDISMNALGVYGAILKIGVILTLFTQMYRMAAEPFFLADFKKADFVKTNAEAMKYFIIASIGIFLIIVLFVDLFALLVGPNFREGIFILPVILISNILAGIVFNLSFWYKQMSKTKFALLVTGVGLVFTIVFNVMLVPKLGYFGSAIARLICEVAMVAVSYVLNRKYCPTPYDLKRIFFYVAIGAMIYIISFATSELPLYLEYLCNLAFLSIFAVTVLRKEKINLKTLIKR